MMYKFGKLIVHCVVFFKVGFTLLYGLQEQDLQIRFSTLAWNEAIRDLYYFDSEKPTSIIVPNGAPSQSHTFSGSSPLTFYTRNAVDGGEYMYKPAARVDIDEGMSDVLLIFFRDNTTGTFEVYPIPIVGNEFRAGDFHINNLTQRNLLLRFGEDRFPLSPGGSRIVRIAVESAQNVEVQMASTDEDENWLMVYQSRWGPPGDSRVWVFFYGDGLRPSIRRFSEFPY